MKIHFLINDEEKTYAGMFPGYHDIETDIVPQERSMVEIKAHMYMIQNVLYYVNPTDKRLEVKVVIVPVKI